MLKDNDTVIHLVILATFVSFGVLFYSLGTTAIEKQTLILEEVRQVGDRLDTLNERVMTNNHTVEDAQGRDETEPQDDVQPERFSFGGYSFAVPPGWQLLEMNPSDGFDRPRFTKNGTDVAYMVCPPADPPSGEGVSPFQSSDFEVTTRTVTQGDRRSDVELMLGESEGVSDLNMIDMKIDNSLVCRLMSDKDFTGDMEALEQDFRDIFSTTELQS